MTTLAPLEQAVVALLAVATGKPVGTRVPATRPAAFVVVQRSGGAIRNRVQSDPSLLVQCWGSTEAGAWDLTVAAWEALASADEATLTRGVDVMRVSLTEPANYPDEATGSPRYTFIFTATVNTN